jgi:hypothetical protein
VEPVNEEPRTLVWFSAGAASAIAAKIVLQERTPNVVIAYIDPGSEHADNTRFVNECETWFDHPIERLRSEKFADTWHVWETRRFIVSPQGAPCTAELKKRVRYAYERPTDIQVFGYTAEEQKRADRFREQNPGIVLSTPLIDRQLNKSDCLALLDRAGIALPAMYQMGYKNNNCIGCPKGGMGYWNKIRQDFPDVYARMAALERNLQTSVLRSDGKSIFLDELDPARGDHANEPDFECSLSCVLVETQWNEG